MGLLASVRTDATARPPRVFFYAREKWGKTSLGAHAPGVIYFMTRGETGLLDLISAKLVPPTPHVPYDFAKPPTWSTLLQAVRELRAERHDYKTLVVDTANGAETLCQDFVRQQFFGNKQAKFDSYGKGWNECRIQWARFLADLDDLNSARGMAVLFLAHTQVKKFDDPTAEESYDRYRPACNDKLWDLTHKWSDCICFGHFETQTYESEGGKTKARREVLRAICFDQSPLWDGGNRYNISGSVDASRGGKAAWADFARRFNGRFDLVPPSSPPAPPPRQEEQPRPAAATPPPEVEEWEPHHDMVEDLMTDVAMFRAQKARSGLSWAAIVERASDDVGHAIDPKAAWDGLEVIARQAICTVILVEVHRKQSPAT